MAEVVTDRRVRKTKRLLRGGLGQLLKVKPVNQISVREISDLVDINRGTFYLHYSNIFDMVTEIEQEMFAEIDQLLDNAGDGHDALPTLTAIFEYFADNAEICAALMGPNGDLGFWTGLKERIRRKWLATWLSPDRNLEYFDYYFNYATAGTCDIVMTWLSGGMVEPPNQMAAIAKKIITTGNGILR
jgi:AcrR family transcriptional regulator